MVGLGGGGELGVVIVFVAVEPEAIAAEEFGGDVFWCEAFACEFDEAEEVEFVVAGGVEGTAFFYF